MGEKEEREGKRVDRDSFPLRPKIYSPFNPEEGLIVRL